MNFETPFIKEKKIWEQPISIFEVVHDLVNGTIFSGEHKLKTKILEGDEEKEYLKKTSEAMVKMRQKQKTGRKRKGNFGGGGKHSKNARRN